MSKKKFRERRSYKSRVVRVVKKILETTELSDHQQMSLVTFAIVAKAMKI